MPAAKSFEHLPKNVCPIHYDIQLQPDLKKLMFAGKVKITVDVKDATNFIILNSLDLVISSAKFTSKSNAVLVATDIKISVQDEIATFSFESLLPLGEGELEIIFTGELNDQMKGFYRCRYTNLQGEELFGGCTQFEATDARRAFPCWDEPEHKTTFDITLIVPKDRVALSNMGVVKSSSVPGSDNLQEIKFATTPVMSTYLVAVVVGEYDFVEGKTAEGVDVRIYTPVGKKDQGTFALEVATKSLSYYNNYFKIPYPLSKLDLIAIPDFELGAMENWGLVTYREKRLLVDEINTSSIQKQNIALVVAHELAHMWFGNLVTMKWWTHLWLKEGFATFIEYLCVDHLFPEFDIWTQFVSSAFACALELDALNNSHPIEIPVGHPSEIEEIFDEISYEKGASVIKMLHAFIGDENFRKGLNIYLTRHSYKNAETEDLWKALEEASSQPIATIMRTWTKQKGFPVITVSSRQDGSCKILSISQEKFCADGNPAGDNSKWLVPISISTSENPKKIAKQILLESPAIEVVLENCSSDSWVKLNPGASGYFRVQYTGDMLCKFIGAIETQTLPPLDRLNLHSDLFALVQCSRIPTVDILKFMDAYINETNYTVWSSITDCMEKISTLLKETDFSDRFLEYGCKLFAKIHQKLGWEPSKGESHLDTLLRGLVIGRLASFGDDSILKISKKKFEEHADGTSVIPADLRASVYRAAAASSEDKVFDAIIKLYLKTDLHEEKDRLARGLGAVKDAKKIRRVLEFSLSNDVRSQDSVFVIIFATGSKLGREMAWNFFKENKDEIHRRYESSHLMSYLIKGVTEGFTTEEKALEIESFFSENPMVERTVKQAVETVRLNAKWLNRDGKAIKEFLNKC